MSEHPHNPYPPPSAAAVARSAVADYERSRDRIPCARTRGWTLAGVGSVLAVIFGHVAIGQISRSGGTQGGRGMALAGVVMGWIAIGFAVIVIIAMAADASGY